MDKNYDVIGIGNAIVDVIFAASDEFLLEHAIAKSVMTLIDEFRAAQAGRGRRECEAKAPAARRRTPWRGSRRSVRKGCFVGKVKKDRLGRSFAGDMRRIGVAFRTADGDGGAFDRLLHHRGDAGRPSQHEHLSRRLPRIDARRHRRQARSAPLPCSMSKAICGTTSAPKAAIRKAIAAAKGPGGKIAFTLSDPFCVGRYRDEFLHLMRDEIDILFANEEEAKALFEVESFDAGAAGGARVARACGAHAFGKGLRDRGTRGRGACAAGRAGGASVLDTTGAGDQFAAGFLLRAFARAGLADLRAAGRDRGRGGDLALRRPAAAGVEGARSQGGIVRSYERPVTFDSLPPPQGRHKGHKEGTKDTKLCDLFLCLVPARAFAHRVYTTPIDIGSFLPLPTSYWARV